MSQPLNILVTGATGYIGGRLVPRLRELGHSVRVLAREPRKLDRRSWKDVEIVKGDCLRAEDLDAALVGVDVAYYLIHSMTTSKGDFAARDREAAENFRNVAQKQSVKRIIYLGGLGKKAADLSAHLRSRHETGEILRSGQVPVTELRAAIIVGSGSASFTIIHDLVSKLPVMLCPRWVKSRCEPIAIRDVLAYLTAVLQEKRSIGEVLEIGSGEELTYAEMMRQCAKVLNRPLLIIHVPVLTPRLSSYWLNLVTGVPFKLAQPLVEGLRNDVVCTDRRMREWFPFTPLSYEEAVRLAVEKIRLDSVETAWTEATTHQVTEFVATDSQVLREVRMIECQCRAENVFREIERLGGKNGWYHADFLWRLRGVADWLIGGVGMRRLRRNPERLAVGDPLDLWRVHDLVPGRRLVLRAEMRVPGEAFLTFEVAPNEERSRLTLQAEFLPSGRWGRIYWYAVSPAHGFVFRGLLREIAFRAEQFESKREAQSIPNVSEDA